MLSEEVYKMPKYYYCSNSLEHICMEKFRKLYIKIVPMSILEW